VCVLKEAISLSVNVRPFISNEFSEACRENRIIEFAMADIITWLAASFYTHFEFIPS